MYIFFRSLCAFKKQSEGTQFRAKRQVGVGRGGDGGVTY